MTVKGVITKNLDNNYVQVEFQNQNKKIDYKVPKDKADSFIKHYTKNESKNNLISIPSLAITTFGTIKLAESFTKNIKNKFLKCATNLCAGVISGTVCLNLTNRYFTKAKESTINSHQAKIMEQPINNQ